MNTKFDSFISEMMGSEGSSETSNNKVFPRSELEVNNKIRSIRQDLTKCSSNLDNFASQFEGSSPKAMAIRQAMMKVDAARDILFNLQD
jgi:hypothetical protein